MQGLYFWEGFKRLLWRIACTALETGQRLRTCSEAGMVPVQRCFQALALILLCSGSAASYLVCRCIEAGFVQRRAQSFAHYSNKPPCECYKLLQDDMASNI